MDVVDRAVGRGDFADDRRATVAHRGIPLAELVAGVGQRDILAPLGRRAAGKPFQQLGRRGALGQAEFGGQRAIEHDPLRRRRRRNGRRREKFGRQREIGSLAQKMRGRGHRRLPTRLPDAVRTGAENRQPLNWGRGGPFASVGGVSENSGAGSWNRVA